MARHAHLVGQQRDLDQVLDHDAEHDVVRDLADAREFAVADVGHAGRREHLDHRHDGLAGGFRAGNDRRQLAGLDHLGVAATPAPRRSRRRVLEASCGCRRNPRPRWSSSRRRSSAACRCAGDDAVLAEIDLLEVLAGRHDREQHVDAGEVGELVDDLAALGGERLGLGAGAVPDRDVVAGLEQPLGHRIAHAAHADPADLLVVLRHTRLLAVTLQATCAQAVIMTGGRRLQQR